MRPCIRGSIRPSVRNAFDPNMRKRAISTSEVEGREREEGGVRGQGRGWPGDCDVSEVRCDQTFFVVSCISFRFY